MKKLLRFVACAAAVGVLGVVGVPTRSALAVTVEFADTFDRADSGALGSSWSEVSTTDWSIVSNKLALSGSTGRQAMATTAMSSSSHYVEAIGTQATDWYLIAGSSNTSLSGSFYIAGFHSASGQFRIQEAPAYNTIAFVGGSFPSNADMRFEVEAGALRLYRNDVLLISGTDGTPLSGTYVGVWAAGSASRYDNFAAGLLTTPPPANPCETLEDEWLPDPADDGSDPRLDTGEGVAVRLTASDDFDWDSVTVGLSFAPLFVPASAGYTREEYLALLESLGFTVDELRDRQYQGSYKLIESDTSAVFGLPAYRDNTSLQLVNAICVENGGSPGEAVYFMRNDEASEPEDVGDTVDRACSDLSVTFPGSASFGDPTPLFVFGFTAEMEDAGGVLDIRYVRYGDVGVAGGFVNDWFNATTGAPATFAFPAFGDVTYAGDFDLTGTDAETGIAHGFVTCYDDMGVVRFDPPTGSGGGTIYGRGPTDNTLPPSGDPVEVVGPNSGGTLVIPGVGTLIGGGSTGGGSNGGSSGDGGQGGTGGSGVIADGGAEASCMEQSGMSLTSPSSWVRGIGRMTACLARVLMVTLFIPEDGFIRGKFEEISEDLETQFPFSIVYVGIDTLDEIGDEIQAVGGDGCFDFGSVNVDGVVIAADESCVGDGFALGSGQRQAFAALLIGPMFLGLCAHAFSIVRDR